MRIVLRTLLLAVLLFCAPLNLFSRPYQIRAQSNNAEMGTADIIRIPVDENRKIRVACLGNSITEGSGIPNPGVYSYPGALQSVLGDAFDVRNFGLGGRTLLKKGDYPYVKEPIYTKAKNFNPDIIILKFGTNDTKPQNWKYEADFEADYLSMINELRALPSNPRIYLCTILYVASSNPYDITEDAARDGVNPKVKSIAARESLDIIDFYALTKDKPELYYDGVHPNVDGSRIMAEFVKKRLIETLSVKSPYTVNAGPENVWLMSTPKSGCEFVNWSDGKNTYGQPSVLYSQNKAATFTAAFVEKEKTYCPPVGTIEGSRFLKKLWVEVNGKRVDIIGNASTDITTFPCKLQTEGKEVITVKRGGSFTIKGVSNNPSPATWVDPMRYAVILPFADWNGDLVYGGRDTNESLPMIGRACNTSGTDADAMAVVNLNRTFTVPADAKPGKIYFRLNYTDGRSADVGYGGSGVVTHTACSFINKGISVEIPLNIIESDARFSFAFSAGANGRVETATPNGMYDAFTEIKLKAVATDDDHWFLNWTDQDGNVVSKSAEFTHTLTGDVTLTANFEAKNYFGLTHYYNTKTQVNRFLNKVTYTAGGTTKTLFDMGTSFTSIPVNTDINDGTAMVDKFDTRIMLPEGTSSFTITCFSTHLAIDACNNEIGWCNQAAMVDWNKDFLFTGAEIYAPTKFSGAEIPGHTFGNVSGYSRTVTIPSGQKSGVYRMYLMYAEPVNASSASWPSEMLNERRVRNGNVYAFDVQLGTVSGVENVSDTGAHVYVSGDVLYINNVAEGSVIDVVDLSGKPVLQTVASSHYTHCILPVKGVYIIHIQSSGQRSNFKVVY